MAGQLPTEVHGIAGVILTFGILSMLCCLTLLWLVCVHKQATSYIAMLSFFVALGCLGSIIQQIHYIVAWTSIKLEQHAALVEKAGTPAMTIGGPIVGLDAGLFAIQSYAYNVDSLIILFWAIELTGSVYRVPTMKQLGPYVDLSAKFACITIPILQIGLKLIPAVYNSMTAYVVVINIPMAVSLGVSSLLLLSILFKYVWAKRAMASWNFQYGTALEGNSSTAGANRSQPGPRPPQSMYDNWLLIRFTVAFLALFVFQAFSIYWQFHSALETKPEKVPPHADVSVRQCVKDFVLFLPGASQGFIAAIVFGTTRTFRVYLLRRIAPRRFWERRRAIKAVNGVAGESVHHRMRSTPKLQLDVESQLAQQQPTDQGYEGSIDLYDMDGPGRRGTSSGTDDDELLIMSNIVPARR